MDVVDYSVSSPAVVLDNVSMTYRVGSSENVYGPDSGFARRALSRVWNPKKRVTVQALRPISLVAQHGESIGVIGRNGSGKSTLMRLIGGQETSTTGSVLATSTPISLGVSAALVPDLAGDANIMLGCLAMGMSKKEIREKFDSIVELSALENSIHLPMKSYSSGMSARLRFAIAAAIDPEILILDEALNTGDAEFGERTRRRMTELREGAGCVFLVSHGMPTIRDLCTRAIWLDQGEMIQDGEVDRVVDLYEKFIWHLRKGDSASADRVKRAARKETQRVQVLERAAGRRRVE
ncbi:ABC transporter ATP-binding protein [Pseudarthrobacter sp. J1738]|uniref:ABC transporter ATP-binding protein n=1 Tax=unclassified Pseudarthrobacter TaxID=2647000 RepID=UPI003D28B76A